MKRSDFNFFLPKERIAQYPTEKRDESKLMLLERSDGRVSHHVVRDMPDIIESVLGRSLLVFNNSKVRKARIFGLNKDTGRAQEFLLLGRDSAAGNVWSAITKKSALKRSAGGNAAPVFVFEDGLVAGLAFNEGGNNGDIGGNCTLTFSRAVNDEYLNKYGHIPLPPYIKRADTERDGERYQTVYSKETGSAAAPTAGLHWSRELLERLETRGIETAFVTLHVGAGTFLPVRANNIEEHRMHREFYCIDNETALKIEDAKREKVKVIVVGTTTARTLESACRQVSGGIKIQAGESSTDIFIYGAYKFKAADALFTNFHTPESTLLMLCSAFCAQGRDADDGRKMLLSTYKTALENDYRFFSYGDAMLIV